MYSPETLEEHQAIWDKVIAENIFVICKTPMAKRITQRTLLGFRRGKTNMWAPEDLINKIKNQPELFIERVHKLVGKDMKIKAIVGNPPYQVQNEGNGNGADPVYHLFIDIAQQLSNIVSMIHPARFLFKAGKTPKAWNYKMLNDTHFKVVDYWIKSNDVFPNVDVKGGIAATLWDKNKNFGAIGLFSAHPELNSILKKVQLKHEESFATIVGPREAYGITQTLYDEYPELGSRQSKGHKFSLGANIYEVMPEIFSDEKKDGYIGIYGRYNNKRDYKWVKSSYISKYESFNYYKVFVPEANGTGAIGEVLSTPVIGVPVIGHTDTFLSIGKFASAQEASACLNYVKSKFARCMLGTLKATQHNPKDTWTNVPMQDFTPNSDIDWSKSIEEIDQQLYVKYGLSEEEIAFIESMIKPM